MSLGRERATEFAVGYGETWQSWDIAGFVELFTDDVVYVVHPTEETIVGKEALERYIAQEQAAQGSVSVRMGSPMVDGNHVAAEFWVTTTKLNEQATIAGCLIAQLDPADGRCMQFREYWFDIEQHTRAYDGWGE
jgi:ketosteroid isomerase-like protein